MPEKTSEEEEARRSKKKQETGHGDWNRHLDEEPTKKIEDSRAEKDTKERPK
jgi:hypothetical protein